MFNSQFYAFDSSKHAISYDPALNFQLVLEPSLKLVIDRWRVTLDLDLAGKDDLDQSYSFLRVKG